MLAMILRRFPVIDVAGYVLVTLSDGCGAPRRGHLGPGGHVEVPYIAVGGGVTSTYPATVDDPGTGDKIMTSTVNSAAPAVSCARAAGAASRRQAGLRRARMGGCGG